MRYGELVINWLIATLAVTIAAYLLPGVRIDGVLAAVVTALVLGAINALLKPLIIILTLPINIMTLGLFTFVINAFLVLVTSLIVPGFRVGGFGWALLFSLVLSIVQAMMYVMANRQARGRM